MARSLFRRAPLSLELLEDRRLLAGNVISGYVFDDINGNGLRDANEPALANSSIELRNAAYAVVGTTTTDANGFYRFDADGSIGSALQSQTQTINFANGKANTISSQLLNQFNPALGSLQSIEIRVDGRIISDIKIENLDDQAASVAGTVSGTVLVNGPGFNLNVNIAGNAVISKTLAAYDGITDYAGASGVSLGSKTATGSNSQTLTGTALNSFLGTGTVSLSFLAQASTQASGGGNLVADISNQGGGTVTVTYNYLRDNALKAGNYTIIQKNQPTGYLDGRESKAGVIIPNSINTDSISIILGSTDSTENNFGEYRPAALSGFVYEDNNNNGLREATEKLFANMQIKLTGTDDRGQNITLTTKSNANGQYSFDNLRPGQYTITQLTQPAGYQAGKLSVGSLGGTAGTTRAFSNIAAAVGASGTNYNFGHLAIRQPSSSGAGVGKGLLLTSTPKPPAGTTVINVGTGKGLLLTSTPRSTTSPAISPSQPPAGVTVTAGSGTGKGLLLTSTPKPPAGSTVTNVGTGKGLLLTSTPRSTATITAPAGISVTRPVTALRY